VEILEEPSYEHLIEKYQNYPSRQHHESKKKKDEWFDEESKKFVKECRGWWKL